MSKFQVACHLIQWGGEQVRDPEKVLREVAEAGWVGVEGYQAKNAEHLVDLATLAAKYGLHWVNMSGPTDIDTARYNLTLGNKAAEAVHGRRADYGGDNPSDADIQRAARDFAPTIAFCREHGLKCFHHAHLWTLIETVQDAERLLSVVPDLWLLYDTGHLLAGGSNPLDVFKSPILRNRIAHVHLKDFYADDPKTWNHRTSKFGAEGRFAELGAGNMGLDVKAVLQGLEEIGYEGWVSVELDEPFPRRTPAEAARVNREYLRKLGY